MSETIRQLTSLGREEIPDVAGIDQFKYDPHADHFDAALEDAEAREASIEDAKVTPAEQDLIAVVDP